MRISDWSSDVCSSDLAPSSAAPHREAQDDDAAFLRTPSRPGVPAPPPAAVQLRYRRYPPADRGAGDRAALSSARATAHTAPADTPFPCCTPRRSEERRVGKGCVRLFRFRSDPVT